MKKELCFMMTAYSNQTGYSEVGVIANIEQDNYTKEDLIKDILLTIKENQLGIEDKEPSITFGLSLYQDVLVGTVLISGTNINPVHGLVKKLLENRNWDGTKATSGAVVDFIKNNGETIKPIDGWVGIFNK